ncbi:glutathione S-transferase family protein [Merismopedia glauca]|uniref:Glutathione S-transferase n=1 Tax=Merismopedia glauca CCAP 1448/3 TaxID=1296344 RepID=A0A2T1CAH3_9CYAN|nr:glutathione S-transferase family protein [Merismopedia glauca]PSB05244.1 glutathione S-transferase [Merismopedia glauca CCAP 1448/3]
MLELYQFELSQYSEKVRFILDYKGLAYRKIEVTPGVGQLELFLLSGQRQVPVLKDGNRVIADSTSIAMYLEENYPEKPIIPLQSTRKALCLMMEEWADESIGTKSRKVLFGGLSKDMNLRNSVLPSNTPDFLKNILTNVPRELVDILGFGVGLSPEAVKAAEKALKQDLEALCLLLKDSPYLTGDTPTLADLSVAGLSLLLKFPSGPYLNIPENMRGKGVPGFADNPEYETFFQWRDRFYTDYRRPIYASSPSSPNSIEIE